MRLLRSFIGPFEELALGIGGTYIELSSLIRT